MFFFAIGRESFTRAYARAHTRVHTHAEQLQETAENDCSHPQLDSTRTLYREQQMSKGPQRVMPVVECRRYLL